MTLPGFEWLVVDGLACYRATRLLTQDVILDRPRAWLVGRGGPLAVLAQCAWCASVWLAFPVLALTLYAASVWVWIAWPLAVSAVAGYLSERA